VLITHGLGALQRAEELGGTGSYAIQAKIAACHARAPRAEDTDWVRVASLYADLVTLTRSPVVELNRAVAVSMADGPAAGLAVTAWSCSTPHSAGVSMVRGGRGPGERHRRRVLNDRPRTPRRLPTAVQPRTL
jgi:predicted RNA polymerase sigma factor